MLPSDKKGSLKRRPTFKQRKSDASDSPVEIEISLDDSVSSDQGREASANSIDTGHVAGDQGREASADSIDARNVAGDIGKFH